MIRAFAILISVIGASSVLLGMRFFCAPPWERDYVVAAICIIMGGWVCLNFLPEAFP